MERSFLEVILTVIGLMVCWAFKPLFVLLAIILYLYYVPKIKEYVKNYSKEKNK